MTNSRTLSKTAALVALTLLVGCGSMGDMGGVLGPSGGNGGNSPSTQSASLRGTVNDVDTRNQRIDISATNGGRQTIYYDNRTRVTYRSENGSPANLERGDEVDVRLYDAGNGRYVADTIDVTYSVSDRNSGYPNNGNGTYPNTYPSNGGYPSSTQADLQGTVSNIDTRAQRIDLNVTYRNNLRNSTSSGGSDSVYYDSRTRVFYRNETHPVTDLERGDEISITTMMTGGRVVADTINVIRNVRQ